MTTLAKHTQLVWDSEGTATAQAHSGASLKVGPQHDWSPEQLLVIAAESSLMTEFMRLAREAGLEVMGYISVGVANPHPKDPESLHVVVRPCIAVSSEPDAELARKLIVAARGCSPVARALGDCLRVQAEVMVILMSEIT